MTILAGSYLELLVFMGTSVRSSTARAVSETTFLLVFAVNVFFHKPVVPRV